MWIFDGLGLFLLISPREVSSGLESLTSRIWPQGKEFVLRLF